jgi:hypothetical protein
MNHPIESTGPDDLDHLLETWAAGREASAERLSALGQQIAAQLADKAPLAVVPDSRSSRQVGRLGLGGFSLRGGPAWFLAGAASVALVVAGSFWLHGDRPQEPTIAGKSAPVLPTGYASLPHEQLLAKARLFAEMQTVFGGQLEWIAETTDHVELGLGKVATASKDPGSKGPGSREHGPLIVRVVVERRAAGTADWKVVWATDVVALDQEPVTLRAAEGTIPAALSLWAYRLPDGMVFVESDLTLSGLKSALESASSNILENNRATEVGSVDVDGAEYRILQTAATLDGDLG